MFDYAPHSWFTDLPGKGVEFRIKVLFFVRCVHVECVFGWFQSRDEMHHVGPQWTALSSGDDCLIHRTWELPKIRDPNIVP